MKILVAGGSGFLGRALTHSLTADGHQVLILTRKPDPERLSAKVQMVPWDGRTEIGWGRIVNDVDAIVNLCGKSLASGLWTPATKQKIIESRVQPGRTLAEAVQKADRPPGVFIQASGINHYGLQGAMADESTSPGGDFLARLTIEWENSTESVEQRGVRRVIIRSAVVLDNRGGSLPLMALPVRLFLGGPMAGGRHSMPWIHLADEIGAIRYLIENEDARGPFNLIAPAPTSNADFMRALAGVLHRPYWFPMPGNLLKFILGEMSDLVVKGRFVLPRRLTELGYRFRFEHLNDALADLFG